jgi:hypothetical protein
MIFNPTYVGESSDDGKEESPPPKQTAAQLTWVVDSKTLMKSAKGIKGVEERYQELGLSLTEANGKKNTKAQLAIEVRKYFAELHKKEGSSYLESDSFQKSRKNNPSTNDRSLLLTQNKRPLLTF